MATELTVRERDLLKLSLSGLTDAELAQVLGRKRQSLKNERAEIYKKLGVGGADSPAGRNAHALLDAARAMGWIDTDKGEQR